MRLSVMPASATGAVATGITRLEQLVIPGDFECRESRIAGRRRGPFFLEVLNHNLVPALPPMGKLPFDPSAREVLPEPAEVIEFLGIELGKPALAECILEPVVAKKSLDRGVDARLSRCR
ncbi:MAG TPA: hypothetical protein VE398_16530 [Acidobacteriota bacterium]|nr:hypothetical protein [Acidobacteriota bacterium]